MRREPRPLKYHRDGVIDKNELRIPMCFYHSTPTLEKMELKRRQYINNPLSLWVTIDSDNVLTDGYANLMVLLEMGVDRIPYVRGQACTLSSYHLPLPELPKLTTPRDAASSPYARPATIEMLFHAQEERCYLCDRPMTLHPSREPDKDLATLDHIFPRNLGGSNAASNLKVCCKRCNELKGEFLYTPELVQAIKHQRTYEEEHGLTYRH